MVGRPPGRVQDPRRDTIAGDPAAWIERHAIAAEDQPGWLPGQLAERLHADGLGLRRTAPLTPDEPEPWATAGTAATPPLGLRGEDNSTSSREDAASPAAAEPLGKQHGRTIPDPERLARLIRAAQRVDAAHRLLHDQLIARANRASTAWDLVRSQALRDRAAAVERRRQQTELCVSGRDFVAVYVCTACGLRQQGVPLTCNSRVCPRCVATIRNRATAHLHDVIELTEQRRLRAGRQQIRWRFLTLTVPSTPQFLPQRHWLGRAWGRLLRRDFWGERVRAALASLETTHTRAGWHVHLHALCDAFLPRAQLVREWQDACLRELLADAAPETKRPDAKPRKKLGLWRAAPLHPQTVKATKALLRLGRRVPAVREGSNHRVDLLVDTPLERDIELQDLVPGAVVFRWDQTLQDEFGNPLQLRQAHPSVLAGVPEPLRPLVSDQLDQLLAMLPRGSGVYIKEATGDRASLVREMAKYLAKDLGGSTSDGDDEWGVAGTTERLAEFLDGSFRWRAFRTYGECYHAGAELDALANGQCCGKCGGDVAWDQVACCEPGQRLSLPRCGHASERLPAREPP